MTEHYYDKTIYNQNPEYLSRDRRAYEFSVLKWISDNLENISKRKSELTSIGYVNNSGYFIRMLKESELNFVLGAYYSSLSIAYILTEDLCKLLAKENEINVKNQYERINELFEKELITESEKNELNHFRTQRNDIWHSNGGFKSLDSAKIEEYTLSELNRVKVLVVSVLNRTSYDNDDIGESLVLDLLNNNYGTTLNQEELIMKNRNFLNEKFGINIAPFKTNQLIQNSSVFFVEKVDLIIEPKEATLIDIFNGLHFIVDLKENQLDDLKSKEKSFIAGTVFSEASIRGQTETFYIEDYIDVSEIDFNFFK